MKYIDAEKLKTKVKELNLVTKTYEEQVAFNNALAMVVEIIASLQQEQPDLLSGEDVMTMCNQVLIDWTKEGKTQEEIEQREQAHSRFFELYDDYLMQEQPEVDLEKEIAEHAENMPHSEFTHESECVEHEEWAKIEFRHFYSLGLNARNV
jgi:hypothetical protein